MSHDQFVSPHDDTFDIESIRQFWDATLRRIKAYAESSEAVGQPTVDATRRSDDLTNGRR
jgi:hypothetical protein